MKKEEALAVGRNIKPPCASVRLPCLIGPQSVYSFRPAHGPV